MHVVCSAQWTQGSPLCVSVHDGRGSAWKETGVDEAPIPEPALASSDQDFPDRQRPPESPPATEWRDPHIMGTPASIVCDLPPHNTPKSCTRKRASANIFQGVELLQLRHLFHSSGDAQAEERARLVWECAGSQCIAQALQRLHRRQRKLRLRSPMKPPSQTGSARLLELQSFRHLRIEDYTTSDGDGSSGKKETAGQTNQYPASHCRKRAKGSEGYLHQIHH